MGFWSFRRPIGPQRAPQGPQKGPLRPLRGSLRPANKRNGRDQRTHLAMARAALEADHPDGSWRYRGGRVKGTKVKNNPKRDAVISYAREHPGATQREISAATGVSLTTVYKWVRWMREQGDSGEA